MNDLFPSTTLLLYFPLATLIGGVVGLIIYHAFFKNDSKQNRPEENSPRDWEISSDD